MFYSDSFAKIFKKIYDIILIPIILGFVLSSAVFLGRNGLCNNFESIDNCIASANQITALNTGDFDCNRKVIFRGDSLDCSGEIISGVAPYNNNSNFYLNINGSTTPQEPCEVFDSFTPFKTFDMGNGSDPSKIGEYSQFNNHTLDNTIWETVDIDDWDGDGEQNLLLNTPGNIPGSTNQVAIWETYKGEYSIHKNFPGNVVLINLVNGEYTAGMGDFDNNGLYEIATHNQVTGELKYYFLNSNLTTVTSNIVVANVSGSDWRTVAIEDMNNDNKSDIIWQYIGPTPGIQPVVWFMDGSVNISGTGITNGPGAPSAVNWNLRDVKDANLDGKPDFLWQNINPGGNTVTLYWYLDGTNYIMDSPVTVIEPNWKVQVAGDLIEGQQPDILLYSEISRPYVVCKRINTEEIYLSNVQDIILQLNGSAKAQIQVKVNTDPQTFVIKHTREYGPGSLARALRVANSNGPSKDVIKFDFDQPATFNLDYENFSGLFNDQAPNFIKDPFDIYNPVHIDGSTGILNGENGITFNSQNNNNLDFITKIDTKLIVEGDFGVNHAITDGFIDGWAVSRYNQRQPIDVFMYINNDFNTPVASSKTGIERLDIQQEYGFATPDVGFRIYIPSQYCNNTSYNFTIRSSKLDGVKSIVKSGNFSLDPSQCPLAPTIGAVEGVTSRGGVKGYVFEQGNAPKILGVRMNINTVFTGTPDSSGYTVIQRDDINSQFSINGTSGFELEIPSVFCDSQDRFANVHVFIENTGQNLFVGRADFNLDQADCTSDFSAGVLATDPNGSVMTYQYDIDDKNLNPTSTLYDITGESSTVSRSYNGTSSTFAGQNFVNPTLVGLNSNAIHLIEVDPLYHYGINRDYEILTNLGSSTGEFANGPFKQSRYVNDFTGRKYTPSGSKINNINFINSNYTNGRFIGIINNIPFISSFSNVYNSPIADIEISNNNFGVDNNGNISGSTTINNIYIETSSNLTQHNHRILNNNMVGNLEMNHLGCIHCINEEKYGHSQMTIKDNFIGVKSDLTGTTRASSVRLERFGRDTRFQNQTGSIFEGNQIFGSSYFDGDGAVLSGNNFGWDTGTVGEFDQRDNYLTLYTDNYIVAPDFDAMPDNDAGTDKIFENDDVADHPVYYSDLQLTTRLPNTIPANMILAGKNNQIYGNSFPVIHPNNSSYPAHRITIQNPTGTFDNPIEIRDNKIAGNSFSRTGVLVVDSSSENDNTQIVRNIFSGNSTIDFRGVAGADKNDIGDLDTGANELQNVPVIAGFKNDGTNIKVQLVEHVDTITSSRPSQINEISIANTSVPGRNKSAQTYLFTCDLTNRVVLNSNYTYTNIDGNSDTGELIECSFPIADLPTVPTLGTELAILSVDQYCTIGTAGNDKCRPSSEFGVNIINNLGVEVQSSGGGNSNTSTVGGVHKVGNFTYTLTPRNDSGDNTLGTITIDYTLDTSKLNYISASGSGWSCGFSTPVVSCTSESTINSGANGAPIVVTVNAI